MTIDDLDTIERLDVYLDGVALNARSTTTGLDPALLFTDRHLRRLYDVPTPAPAFAKRLRQHLLAGDAQATSGNGHAGSARVRWRPLSLVRSWSRGTVSAAATAAVLILTLVSAAMTYRLAGVGPGAETRTTHELYVSTGVSDECEGPVRLVQIDATTLRDLDDPHDLVMCDVGPVFQTWNFSADGSTVVAIEYAYPRVTSTYDPSNVPDDAVTIVVRDGRTVAERVRFHPPARVAWPRLSTDGTRLVVEVVGSELDSRVQPPAWYVFDTSDGRLLSTVQVEGPLGWESWIDADARRLYRLVPSTYSAPPPVPMTLVAYDLTSGAEAGRLELASVLGGNWQTDQMVDVEGGDWQVPLWAQMSPGFAVSPDGRRLAIVHADADAVTLIDAERLAVEETISLTRPTGWLDQLAGLLPFMPSNAEAKGLVLGTVRRAAFAPDGGRLYAWGFTVTADDSGAMTAHGLGLQLLDLDRATIVVDGLADEELRAVFPAPDGRSLYTVGPGEPTGLQYAGPSELTVVRRLDADTLDTLSERAFDGWRMLVLRPVAAP